MTVRNGHVENGIRRHGVRTGSCATMAARRYMHGDIRMSAILNVRAVLGDYWLPADFKAALEQLLLSNVNRVHSRTRISAKPLSIKTQERRTLAICKSFE